MQAIHRGETSRLIEQADTSLEMDYLGIWTATALWKCPWDKVLQFAPARFSQHPTFHALLLTRNTVTREPGSIGVISSQYSGFMQDQVEEEANSTVSAEPLLTHPAYSKLTAKDLAEVNEFVRLVKVGQVPESGARSGWDPAKKELSSRLIAGQESWYLPRQTFRRSYASATRPSRFNLVGFIDSPPDAPPLENGHNWLLTMVCYRRIGGAYQIQEEWTASGPLGWDPTLYTRTSQQGSLRLGDNPLFDSYTT